MRIKERIEKALNKRALHCVTGRRDIYSFYQWYDKVSTIINAKGRSILKFDKVEKFNAYKISGNYSI